MNVFDQNSKKFILVCGLCFLVAVALKLNGSSTFIWKEFLKDDNKSTSLILSTPKKVRSDEWEVWTPALLWQASQTPSFPTENPSLGSGKVPLIYNLPTRHYTMLFRPQYWGFFFFDLETGYSIYWNSKIFGLLISIFLLLQLLTRNNFLLSVTGSLWVFFSNYTQWWFSCPPMLPEMLSCWAFAILCATGIFTANNNRNRRLATAGFVFSGINFALCLYPPFQISLLQLGACIFIGLLWEEKNAAPKGNYRAGAIYLVAALALMVAVLIPFFIECMPTLKVLSHTSYPGNRRSNGGAMTVLTLFSGVMNPFNTEDHYPEMYDSVNAAANFYPLWAAALCVFGYIVCKTRKARPVAVCILACSLLFLMFGMFHLPAWLCNITLLSFCTEVRNLLAIGIAGIFFTILVLNEKGAKSIKFGWIFSVISTLFLFSAVLAYLLYFAKYSPKFLSFNNLAWLAAVNLLIITLFVKAPLRLFCAVFVTILAVTNATVNPVMIGLSPLLAATPRQTIQQIQNSHPNAKWVAYEDNVLAEFLMAMGANVLNGLKIVPNLDFYKQIDPDGTFKPIYNRYSFAAFISTSDRKTISIHNLGFPTHVVEIHPANPALKANNVKYVVFRRCLQKPADEGLSLVRGFAENHLWIYELTD